MVTLQYSYETQAGNKTQFWITVKREFSNYVGQADWQIVDFSLIKPRSN